MGAQTSNAKGEAQPALDSAMPPRIGVGMDGVFSAAVDGILGPGDARIASALFRVCRSR
jgi:hypothetical protein